MSKPLDYNIVRYLYKVWKKPETDSDELEDWTYSDLMRLQEARQARKITAGDVAFLGCLIQTCCDTRPEDLIARGVSKISDLKYANHGVLTAPVIKSADEFEDVQTKKYDIKSDIHFATRCLLAGASYEFDNNETFKTNISFQTGMSSKEVSSFGKDILNMLSTARNPEPVQLLKDVVGKNWGKGGLQKLAQNRLSALDLQKSNFEKYDFSTHVYTPPVEKYVRRGVNWG